MNSDLYRQIIEAFPGHVFLKDKSGVYLDCSESFCEFTGLSKTDIIGKTSFEVLPQQSAEWASRLDRLMFEKNQSSSEIYPFALKDGELTDWQRVKRAPLLGADGELIGLIGTLESVGGAFAFAEDLTRAKARFVALSEVMQYSSFVVILWDAGSLAADYVSDNAKSFGFSGFLNLDEYRECVAANDLPAFDAARADMFSHKNGLDFWVEYRINSRGGEKWVHEHVTSVNAPGAHYYRSMIIDSTARHLPSTESGDMPAILKIISKDYLQSACDHISNTLGLSCSIIDPDGAPITDKQDVCDICAMIRATGRGETLCNMSDVNLGLAARDAGALVVYPCEPLGFYTAAIPISIGGKHLATMIVGRVRPEGAEININALAARLGLDADAARTALEQSPAVADPESLFKKLEPYARELSDFVYRSWLLLNESEQRAGKSSPAKDAERERRQSESLEHILNCLNNAVYVVDANTYEVLFANTRFVYGGIARPRGIPCFRELGGDMPCHCCAMSALDGKPVGYTYVYETDERESGCWHSIRMTVMEWRGGRRAYLVRVRDITDDKFNQQQLLRAATYDLQLRVPNYSKLVADLGEVKDGYLFVLRVENLKLIAGAYGYEYGVALLLEVGKALKDAGRVYRHGSASLAVIAADRGKCADIIRSLFSRNWRILEKRCWGVFNVGVAQITGAAIQSLRDADSALAQSQLLGKNNISFEKRESEHMANISLANDLHKMVADGVRDITVYYQPIFDIATGKIARCEALMRWKHPKLGIVPPLEFLRIAEDTALMVPISEELLDQVLKQCREWNDMGVDVGVAVNLSAAHSRQAGILGSIETALRKYDLPPEKLEIEITESITLNDRAYILDFTKGLKAIGCPSAIDNFGAALTNLEVLENSDSVLLKLDRAIIGDITENDYHRHLVRFAVETAKLLGKELACEGIETIEQLVSVKTLGAKFAQGYLLQRPRPAAEITDALMNQERFEMFFQP